MKKIILCVLITIALISVFMLVSCEFDINNKHRHAYGEWEIVQEATDVDEGIEKKFCECGEYQQRYIHTGSEGLKYEPFFGTYFVSDGKACTDANVIIPNTYNGVPVTRIASEAFRWNKEMKSIVIPDSVREIGNMAFYACSSLESVTFGNSLEVIGDEAFLHCGLLSDVELPDSLITIGDSAFASCESFKTFTISKSVEKVGDNFVMGCPDLEKIYVDEANECYKDIDGILYSKDGKILIKYPEGRDISGFVIPEGVTTIYKSAFINTHFSDCFEIPEGVTHIGEEAFFGCPAIYIPSSVVSIADNAFYLCWGLTHIDVAPNNEHYSSIDGNLYTKDGKSLIKYAGAKNEESFIVPNGVEIICEGAFSHSIFLINITLPDSLRIIGECAFLDCQSLESIDIPESVTDIGTFAFGYCKSLTEIVIPNSVKTIYNHTFSDCSSLVSITMSNSVKDIEYCAFYNCFLLENIYFDGTLKEWRAINKAYGWNDYCRRFTINCTDGVISSEDD